MTKLDQFESVFRAAARTAYVLGEVEIGSVLVVSDLEGAAAEAFGARVRGFLGALDEHENLRWRVAHGGEFSTVPELLALMEAERPGLVCTYRHLHSQSWRWPYTLGEHLDVLTQVTTTPVLVMPHPAGNERPRLTGSDTSTVMAMTDHVSGDSRLVDYAVRFTTREGTLILAQVEDDGVFERYMEAISKISSIDTDGARQELLSRLLKDSADYIESCRTALAGSLPSLTVDSEIRTGHHLREYECIIEDHEVDLLVMNTKDDDQLAMHGLAYPLAVELRDIPLLML